MTMLPPKKPQLAREEAEAFLKPFGLGGYLVRLLGVRAYYKNTMGVEGKNDIGIYDDALFLVTPSIFLSFNANTDPSRSLPHVAVVKPGGPYLYKIGMHNMKAPYKALRQFGRVTVLRDGIPDTDTAAAPFYIDIHKGGYGTTSSLGCQTIYPDQWPAFIAIVEKQMNLYHQEIVPYCLVEQ